MLTRKAVIAVTYFATRPPRVSTGTTTKYSTKNTTHGVRLMMMGLGGMSGNNYVATSKQGAEGCKGSWRMSKTIFLRDSCNTELKLLKQVLHDEGGDLYTIEVNGL